MLASFWLALMTICAVDVLPEAGALLEELAVLEEVLEEELPPVETIGATELLLLEELLLEALAMLDELLLEELLEESPVLTVLVEPPLLCADGPELLPLPQAASPRHERARTGSMVCRLIINDTPYWIQ